MLCSHDTIQYNKPKYFNQLRGLPINLHVAILHCIVRKQAEVVYRAGKQTVYIAK